MVLVGNKNDLHLERVVSTDQGRRLADNWKAAFLETSAKEHEVSHVDYCEFCASVQYSGLEGPQRFWLVLEATGYH